MNRSEFWMQQSLESLIEEFKVKGLVRCNRPAITQTLTYHVEQPVSPRPKLEYRYFAFTGVTWI